MIVPNRGLISKLGDLLGLQLRSNSIQTPAPTAHAPMTGERLDEATHSVYRSVVGVLQYIAGDGPASSGLRKQLQDPWPHLAIRTRSW